MIGAASDLRDSGAVREAISILDSALVITCAYGTAALAFLCVSEAIPLLIDIQRDAHEIAFRLKNGPPIQ